MEMNKGRADCEQKSPQLPKDTETPEPSGELTKNKLLRVGPLDGFEMGDLVMVTSGARNLFVVPAREQVLLKCVQHLSLFDVYDLPQQVDIGARQSFLDNLLQSGVCIESPCD